MRYMTQLDGLRCFAILAVLFEHFAGRGLNRLVPMGAGNMGVSLFFTLSGFLITGILLRAFDRRTSLREAWSGFYIRRVLRLAPIFYVVIAVAALWHIGSFAESWPWHVFYLSNVYIAQGGEKTVFWSLAVEEQFYLLWPFVIAFAPRRALPAICVGLVVTGIAWRIGMDVAGFPKVAANVLLPGSFEPLGVGCLLAVLSYHGGEPNRFGWLTPARQRTFGIVALACLAGGFAVWGVGGRLYVGPALMAVAYGWLVVSAAKGFGGLVGRVLANPVTVYVGRISYGVYIVHNFMPTIVERLAGPMPKAAAAPIVLVATFGICALSYRYFETPIRDWGHRWTRVEERRPAEARAAG